MQGIGVSVRSSAKGSHGDTIVKLNNNIDGAVISRVPYEFTFVKWHNKQHLIKEHRLTFLQLANMVMAWVN